MEESLLSLKGKQQDNIGFPTLNCMQAQKIFYD